MSNSSLISYTKLSPNNSGERTHKIDTITIHCMAGNLSVEVCGSLFANPNKKASSNYGIGSDGRIALYCNESMRSWCSSNAVNDQRSITIEVANCTAGPDWKISNAALFALIDLCEDICKRNDIKRLVWSTDKNSRVNHLNGCNMTIHRDYAAKACPGNYLYSIHNYIAEEVNKRLTPEKQLLVSANDITWELNHTYFPITDTKRFVDALEQARVENSSLYWGFYKLVNGIKK